MPGKAPLSITASRSATGEIPGEAPAVMENLRLPPGIFAGRHPDARGGIVVPG